MTSGTITREQFEVRQIKDKRALSAQKKQVLICAGTGCIAGGSLDIYDYLKEACAKRGIQVQVGLLHEDGEVEAPAKGKELHLKKSGCHGFCEMGPLLQIEPDGILYTHVQVSDCDEIIDKTLLKGELVERLLYQLDGVTYAKHEEIPFYKKQHRVVLENCGTTDAEDIDEYIARDGYAAFEKALFEMTGEEICKEISDSGLRGRGGGGFPAGRKWESVRKQPPGKKYVVCNGDEGDPGAFMDRSIMEGNPHSIIEGMLIAGVAAGSDEGYIYVRAEYPLAVSRLKTAIAKAEEMGFLGDHIMGTDFSFHLHVNRGAGAFVCGEGSALTASIEGNRGMPRVKPPRTVEKGLWARPTVLNNVETFSNVPLIIRKGSAWYRSIGTEKSPGTKAFALTGNVVNTGLIEVPMGTTKGRQEVQGGADRRPLRRLPHRGAPGHAHGLRLPEKGGGHDRLRRSGGHGRGHLHGGGGPVLHELHPERVLRQVRPLPGGHPPHAGDPHPHRQQRGVPGGPGPAGGPVLHHHRDRPVRPGPERLQAGAEHLEVFPGRVSGPRGG